MCSTQVKIQEKHLLPLLVLLSEMRCNVSRTEEMTGVHYKRVWSLCLAIHSSNFAFTYSNMIICGIKSKSIPTSAVHKVPVASSSAYLICKKNALMELGSLSKTRSFTAKILELKLFGFYSYLPWSFAGRGINCLLLSHRLHDRCSRMVQFASCEISFLKNADFQAAARFSELLPVLIIWKFTVCISN